MIHMASTDGALNPIRMMTESAASLMRQFIENNKIQFLNPTISVTIQIFMRSIYTINVYSTVCVL